MVHVTAFFAGLLALFYLALSINIIRRRYGLKLALGDGGDAHMIRVIRAHANFIEYTPLILVLMALNELNGTSHGLLTALGVTLVLGRMSHAYSLLHAEPSKNIIWFRTIGMVATFSVMAINAVVAMM